MSNTDSPLTASSLDERPTKRIKITSNSDLQSTASFSSLSSSSACLSPDIWALVMEFLPYESVLQTAAVSKSMLHEVMPLVTMLHIYKSSQLYAGSIAARYRDVRDIYIYSLVQHVGRTVGFPRGLSSVDEDTATRAIPFLCSFPKLERVFLGGQNVNREYNVEGYMPTNDTDDEEKEVMRNLINSFSAGFRSGACK